MPGQLCVGDPDVLMVKNAVLKNSKSFCEGITYRAGGTALERPFADNPHVQSSDTWNAWDYGWTVADDAAGGEISKANAPCCAIGGVILV